MLFDVVLEVQVSENKLIVYMLSGDGVLVTVGGKIGSQSLLLT